MIIKNLKRMKNEYSKIFMTIFSYYRIIEKYICI